ncbi:MAG: cupin domain-containing protein [Paracoccus sp. (in: a-proteobacteria)]|nr:cupin domain-containing protein [Paracoccus sp. (in: a-proteobacteria)]
MTDHTKTATIHISRAGEDRIPLGSGGAFGIAEWTGSGPGYLHAHHDSDMAIHVISGRLRFRLAGEKVDVGPGSTVFVPAGVAHDYDETMPSRYLIVAPQPVLDLLESLQKAPRDQHPAILRENNAGVVV